jgi:uncharacterized protein YkwD
MIARCILIAALAMCSAATASGAVLNTRGVGSATTINQILTLHNNLRTKYRAPALKWNTTLAASAQSWTNQCKFSHDVTTLRRLNYGENLAVVNGPPSYDVWPTGIKGWSNEASLYNFAAPGYTPAAGHFTQMVWKGTTQVGCGRTPNCQVAGFGPGTMYSCRYSPPGNYIGTANFQANVLAPAGRR